jgi:hypothetical protein
MRKTRAEFNTPELNPRHRVHHGRRTRVEFHTPHLDPRHPDFGSVPPKTPDQKFWSKTIVIGLAAGCAFGSLIGFLISRFL